MDTRTSFKAIDENWINGSWAIFRIESVIITKQKDSDSIYNVEPSFIALSAQLDRSNFIIPTKFIEYCQKKHGNSFITDPIIKPGKKTPID